ncbi:hypothetical protein, partial [Aeromonas dhakensis]|uniref:hypothetical protein n=1 Tax=Aeromonas dhakensis TaxID=196024 RepID=UPI0039A206D2
STQISILQPTKSRPSNRQLVINLPRTKNNHLFLKLFLFITRNLYQPNKMRAGSQVSAINTKIQ